MQLNSGTVFKTRKNAMQSYLASAIFVGAFVLAPALAWSQDFSITNKIEPIGPGNEWTRQLQAWWDMHAWYPPDAKENNKEGTVKAHLTVRPDGQIWTIDVVQGSGWKSIDTAAVYAFHGGRLRPLPPAPPAPQADANLTLHFVLGHLPSKPPFTITDDPVHGTVVDANAERTCSGIVNQPFGGPEGGYFRIEASWFRKPDGKPWMKFYWAGKGPLEIPLTELAVSAQWTTPPVVRMNNTWVTHYAAWPDGDNRISGTTIDPEGVFELTCD